MGGKGERELKREKRRKIEIEIRWKEGHGIRSGKEQCSIPTTSLF
tara:strand:- start:334 stop:468 length:135 start_codon:yes stop_codon:yes gene_type:complete